MYSALEELKGSLVRSPIEAVESQAFLKLCDQSPDFYLQLPVEFRWRLLHALDLSLLDYRGALPLDHIWLELPESIGKVSWRDVLSALYCDEFILEGFNWSEVLTPGRPLSEQELVTCEQALVNTASTDRLHDMIASGIAFASAAEDYLEEFDPRVGHRDRPNGHSMIRALLRAFAGR